MPADGGSPYNNAFCIYPIVAILTQNVKQIEPNRIFTILFSLIFQYITKNIHKKLNFSSFFTCQTNQKRVKCPRTPQMRPAISGSVAQLVEQRIENPRVGGSIPSRAIFFVPWLHEILLSTIGA